MPDVVMTGWVPHGWLSIDPIYFVGSHAELSNSYGLPRPVRIAQHWILRTIDRTAAGLGTPPFTNYYWELLRDSYHAPAAPKLAAELHLAGLEQAPSHVILTAGTAAQAAAVSVATDMTEPRHRTWRVMDTEHDLAWIKENIPALTDQQRTAAASGVATLIGTEKKRPWPAIQDRGAGGFVTVPRGIGAIAVQEAGSFYAPSKPRLQPRSHLEQPSVALGVRLFSADLIAPMESLALSYRVGAADRKVRQSVDDRAWIKETIPALTDQERTVAAQMQPIDLAVEFRRKRLPNLPEFSPFAIERRPRGMPAVNFQASAFLAMARARLDPTRHADHPTYARSIEFPAALILPALGFAGSVTTPSAQKRALPSEHPVSWIHVNLPVLTAKDLAGLMMIDAGPRDRKRHFSSLIDISRIITPPTIIAHVIEAPTHHLMHSYRLMMSRRPLYFEVMSGANVFIRPLLESIAATLVPSFAQSGDRMRQRPRPSVSDYEWLQRIDGIAQHIQAMPVAEQMAASAVLSSILRSERPRWPSREERILPIEVPLVIVPPVMGESPRILESFSLAERRLLLGLDSMRADAAFIESARQAIAAFSAAGRDQLAGSEYRLRQRRLIGAPEQEWAGRLEWLDTVIAPQRILQWAAAEGLRQQYRTPERRITAWLAQVDPHAQMGWLSELFQAPFVPFDPQLLIHTLGDRTPAGPRLRLGLYEWLAQLGWLGVLRIGPPASGQPIILAADPDTEMILVVEPRTPIILRSER